MESKRTYNWVQDSSRFHNVGVGKSSVRLSNMDTDTFHTGYGSALYHKGKSPRDFDTVKETKIMQDINKVKERM